MLRSAAGHSQSCFAAGCSSQHGAEMLLISCGLQAVELFLQEKIGYLDIVKAVEATCDAHQQELVERPSLDEIVHFDAWARRHVADAHGSSSSRQPVLA